MSDFGVYNNLPRIMPPASIGKAAAPVKQTPGPSSDAFGSMLKDALTEVNDLEKGSQEVLGKFMNNETDLHTVMIALEKADISFQMMMQVRNKIVGAYQEIMKTQV